jgi:hypothetical protein
MKYDFNLLQPYLPVIQTGKKNVMFPPEICFMDKGQRYPHKLDDVQVRFSVLRCYEKQLPSLALKRQLILVS